MPARARSDGGTAATSRPSHRMRPRSARSSPTMARMRLDLPTPLRPRTQVMRPGSASSDRSEEHTSELQSRQYLVCRLLLEKKNKYILLPSNITHASHDC